MTRKSRKGYYVKGKFVAEGSEDDQRLRDELRNPDAPSRSARKRASKNLQRLGEELIAAPAAVLASLPLPDQLRDAILDARGIGRFGASRRQTQFIGKLMRHLDDETVRAIRTALGLETPLREAAITSIAMNSENSGTDARINELEMRLAHQDQAVHELGNEVYRQQRQIAQLEAALRQLADRLSPADGDPAATRPVDEVPPHY